MAIGALYNADNVVVGQAAVFFGTAQTPLPDLADWNATDPFDLTFWAAPFVPCGATDQGWQFGADKSTQTITIEEQSTPVAVTLTSQSVSFSGALSEDVSATLALALNANVDATVASASSPGFDLLTLSDEPIRYSAAMVMQNAEGFGRIIYAPEWTQLGNASVSFRRAADKRMYPVQFETVCKTSDIKVYNFSAAKTT